MIIIKFKILKTKFNMKISIYQYKYKFKKIYNNKIFNQKISFKMIKLQMKKMIVNYKNLNKFKNKTQIIY